MGRESKPYATMKDGPDAYLFRKDGKQKLVGSADKETCPDCNGSGDAVGFGDVPIDNCPLCDGTGEVQPLEEDEEGYQYRTETDYEEDNSKIWHYGKAPGEDWKIIDRSPYAEMDDFAWDLYVDFHRKNGHWPNQDESRKIEELEYKVMTKMNDDINEIRKLAGLEIVAEDCDETPGKDKNDDGDCSPFTHADDNVDMVREDENCPECDGIGEVWGKPCEVCGGIGESEMEEDFLAPPKEIEDGHYEDDDDWVMRGGEDGLGPDGHGYDRDMSDSEPFSDPYMDEQGPGDDEFDADPDAMVDVGDDEDYEVFDFEDEFDAMMGNTMKYESVVEMNELRRLAGMEPVEESEVPSEMNVMDLYPPTEWWKNDPNKLMTYIYWTKGQLPPEDKQGAWDSIVASLSKKHPAPEGEIPTLEGVMEGEGDKCVRCGKGTMERGETFFGPAERCNRCNYQRQLSESAPHGSDDYDFIDFNDDKAYFIVADEIGDRIIFGMNNEVGIPEQYTDEMIGLLRRHGFEKGIDYDFTVRGNPNHISNRQPEVEEDLQNGYNEHEYADSYDDYFPRGSHQTPSDDLGPTASGYGDNAMDNKMRSKETDEVYEGMRQKYRRYRLS